MKFRFIQEIQTLLNKEYVIEVDNMTIAEQQLVASLLYPYIEETSQSVKSSIKLDSSKIINQSFYKKSNLIKSFVRDTLYKQLEEEGWLKLHASAIKQDNDVTLFIGDSKAGKSSSAFLSVSQFNANFVANDDVFIHPYYQFAIGYPAGFGVSNLVGDMLGIGEYSHIFSENSYWYTNDDLRKMNLNLEYGGRLKRIIFPNFTKDIQTKTSIYELKSEEKKQKIFNFSKIQSFNQQNFNYLLNIPCYSINTVGVSQDYLNTLEKIFSKEIINTPYNFDNNVLGVNYYFGFDNDLQDRFNEVKKNGFNYISINADTISEEKYGGLKNIILQALNAGLKIAYVHGPYCKEHSIKYLFEESLETEKIINFHKYAINLCGKYNIPIYVMHANRKNDTPALDNVCIKNFSTLINFAKTKNVKIAVENITSVRVLQFLLQNIKDENFGLCYDSGHDNVYTKNSGIIDLAKGRIFMVHLHDNYGERDEHNIIGKGNIDWIYILNKLDTANFHGPWMLEIKNPEPNCSMREFLQDNKRRLESVLKKSGVLGKDYERYR